MRAHIFNVDEHTFPVHRDRGFCGTGKKGTPLTAYGQALDQPRYFGGIIADLMGTRLSDLVFFYESKRGFHGVYQIVSPPFFDPQEVRGTANHPECVVGADLPFRLLIQCVDYFPEPVPEDLIFSTPAHERIFWIWFYKKIQGSRGCVTVDPDAARTLLELLIKLNGPPSELEPAPFYYDRELEACGVPFPPGTASQDDDEKGDGRWLQTLGVPLIPGVPTGLEDHLRGWLVGHLDSGHPDLTRILGPMSHIEWFANNVPYHVARRNIDILVFHRTPPGELIAPPLRYRYSVLELKRDRADPHTVDQVVDYAEWVAKRLAGGEVDIVRPCVVAHRFGSETVERARSVGFNRSGIQLVRYEVTGQDRMSFYDV